MFHTNAELEDTKDGRFVASCIAAPESSPLSFLLRGLRLVDEHHEVGVANPATDHLVFCQLQHVIHDR